MKLKSTLLLSALLAVSALRGAAQDTEWNIVTDNGTKVPMTQVGYLIAADNQTNFTVVKTDNTVIEDVTRATFSQEPTSGIADAVADNGTALLATCINNTLAISYAAGSHAEVYDMAGALVVSTPINGGSATIDVTALTEGVYILRVGNTSVKFIKK